MINEGSDFVASLTVNERPGIHAFLQAISHADGLEFCGQFFNQFLFTIRMHKNAIGRHADLAGDEQFQAGKLFCDHPKICIRKHDEGGIAAEFERQTFDARRCCCHERTAGGRGSGEAEHTQGGMLCEHRTHHRSAAWHNLQDTCRKSGLEQEWRDRQGN